MLVQQSIKKMWQGLGCSTAAGVEGDETEQEGRSESSRTQWLVKCVELGGVKHKANIGMHMNLFIFYNKRQKGKQTTEIDRPIKKELAEYVMIFPYGRLNLLCRSQK